MYFVGITLSSTAEYCIVYELRHSSHLLFERQLGRKYIDDRLELYCELLAITNQSFDHVVLCYKVILELFFSDGIYYLYAPRLI